MASEEVRENYQDKITGRMRRKWRKLGNGMQNVLTLRLPPQDNYHDRSR